jgi:hypothetical protein
MVLLDLAFDAMATAAEQQRSSLSLSLCREGGKVAGEKLAGEQALPRLAPFFSRQKNMRRGFCCKRREHNNNTSDLLSE